MRPKYSLSSSCSAALILEVKGADTNAVPKKCFQLQGAGMN
jgi:hypothetical protein